MCCFRHCIRIPASTCQFVTVLSQRIRRRCACVSAAACDKPVAGLQVWLPGNMMWDGTQLVQRALPPLRAPSPALPVAEDAEDAFDRHRQERVGAWAAEHALLQHQQQREQLRQDRQPGPGGQSLQLPGPRHPTGRGSLDAPSTPPGSQAPRIRRRASPEAAQRLHAMAAAAAAGHLSEDGRESPPPASAARLPGVDTAGGDAALLPSEQCALEPFLIGGVAGWLIHNYMRAAC